MDGAQQHRTRLERQEQRAAPVRAVEVVEVEQGTAQERGVMLVDEVGLARAGVRVDLHAERLAVPFEPPEPSGEGRIYGRGHMNVELQK